MKLKGKGLGGAASLVGLGWMLVGCVQEKHYNPPGGIEVHGPSEMLRLDEGGARRVPVTVVRGVNRTEQITIDARGLPVGVTAEPSTIPAGATTGEILLRANGAEVDTEASFSLVAHVEDLEAEASGRVFIAEKPGTLDLRYGEQGKASLPIGGNQVVAALASGAVLLGGTVAGKVTLAKITGGGTVDESFGNGGYLVPPFPVSASSTVVSSIYLVEQADQKIIAIASFDDPATTPRPDALITTRLMANGAVDQLYGTSGYVIEAAPYRPYGAALGLDGELLLWNGGASTTRLTRVLPNGMIGISSPVYDTSFMVHINTKMVVQPDGMAVIPIYEPGLKPALVRFDSSLRLDTAFGRDGKLAVSVLPLSLENAGDGSFVAVGLKGTEPGVMRFDSAWRSLPGFESGGTTFPVAGQFNHAIRVDDATLAVGPINSAARLGWILDDGRIDESYGVGGLVNITSLPAGDAVVGVVKTTAPFRFFVMIARGGAQSTEILRIWQ